MERVYFDPTHPASFGGVDKLYQAVKHRFTKKQVRDWLSGQDSYTLHKQVRKRFPRNTTLVAAPEEQFQADLVDMQHVQKQNDNYKYILTVIDCFSRYAWAIPLKNKTPESVISAFEQIFRESVPLKIQVDKGGEFINRKMKQYLTKRDIHLFTTEDDVVKASIVERFNRTLKTRMYRYFSHANTRRYLDVLPELVNSYNRTKHRSIRMAPVDVNKNNTLQVWKTLHPTIEAIKPKYKVGDSVRIARNKPVFEKGYEANFSREVFVITRVLRQQQQPTYQLKDLNGEPIVGAFYQEQLQNVSKPETYLVEKVLKKRRVLGKPQLLVKWLGYSNEFNSWIDQEDTVILPSN